MATKRFERFAWRFLAYLLAVIAFGAWVRITGSGNGCGTHWPLCQGEVIPAAPGVKTVIEFTHRLTSGLSGLLGIVLLVWARRVSPVVFGWAAATMFFLLVEGFVGAVLVKKELVAGDASLSRAVVIALHLTNTLMLTASAASVAWLAAAHHREVAKPEHRRPTMLYVVLAALVLSNATGAITALGDTIFPVQPALDGGLWAKVRGEISAGHHFLVRLRAIHPLVALVTAGLAAWVLSSRMAASHAARWGLFGVLAQVVLGAVNILLGAPGWLQIAHLLMAQLVWIAVWLTSTEAAQAGRKAPPVVSSSQRRATADAP